MSLAQTLALQSPLRLCCPNLSAWVWVLLVGWGMVTICIFLVIEKLACIPQVEQGAARWEEASPRLALCPIPDCQGGLCEPAGVLLASQTSAWVPSPGYCHPWGNFVQGM